MLWTEVVQKNVCLGLKKGFAMLQRDNMFYVFGGQLRSGELTNDMAAYNMGRHANLYFI